MADVEARLSEIEARANAATEGPWLTLWIDDVVGWEVCDDETGEITVARLPDGGSDPIAPGNARFIAHARQDVPALTAALRATRTRLADYADHGSIDRSVLDEIDHAIEGALNG